MMQEIKEKQSKEKESGPITRSKWNVKKSEVKEENSQASLPNPLLVDSEAKNEEVFRVNDFASEYTEPSLRPSADPTTQDSDF